MTRKLRDAFPSGLHRDAFQLDTMHAVDSGLKSRRDSPQNTRVEVCPTVCTDPPRAHISNGMLDASFTRFLDHLDHNH
jgi:hypothetical protein